jgi:hypothetical protein
MITRRAVLIALGTFGALPAYAQQTRKVWRIGFLSALWQKTWFG